MFNRILKFLKDWLPARISRFLPDVGGVYQVTLDPPGPGFVRIHLKEREGWLRKTTPVLHLNANMAFELTLWQADVIRIFIEEVWKFSKANQEIPDDMFTRLKSDIANRLKRLYPLTSRAVFVKDIDSLGTLFLRVAYNENLGELPHGLSPEAAQNQPSPDMMDIIIKNMTDEDPCNEHCPICYARKTRGIQVPELSVHEWIPITRKIWKAGVSQLTFTGGDPLMYGPGLFNLLLHCREFITRINTNGVLLTPAVAKQLKNAEVDGVQITLYSGDPATHEMCVATRNVFDKTVGAIRNCLAEGIIVSVNVPLINANVDQFLDTLQFLASLGVHYVTCSGLINTGAAVKTGPMNEVPTEKLKVVLAAAKQYANEHDLELDFTHPVCPKDLDLKALGFNQVTCAAGTFKMAIAPNGDVVGCQSDLDGTPYGNLQRQSWKDIWNNPRLQKMRRGVKCPKCGGFHCSCPFDAGVEVNHVDA